MPRRGLPLVKDFRRWVLATLNGRPAVEVTLRIVDEAESALLNSTYRHKHGATNVLSFAFEAQAAGDYLGDIVICAPVVVREARLQGKSTQAHWAHMVVHGILHLLGYDHRNTAEASVMERLETRLLADVGYPDPYQTDKNV
ncbi:MAG: rRNA maturation RNase YbeY [Gammaproteobacteria bacterium]|nr:rRNA maturation RNase YbeY [Gammaproteobacteria bacterium]